MEVSLKETSRRNFCSGCKPSSLLRQAADDGQYSCIPQNQPRSTRSPLVAKLFLHDLRKNDSLKTAEV